MANKIVYPYGTGGELPSSIGIVNDLTTGGADKALSAEMGKVIGSVIASEVTNVIDVSQFTQHTYTLGLSGNWYGTSASHIAIPVVAGRTYILSATSDVSGGWYGLCTDFYTPPTTTSAIPYVSDTSRVWQGATSSSVEAPNSAAWLILSTIDGDGHSITWQVTEKYSGAFGHLETEVDAITQFLEIPSPDVAPYSYIGEKIILADHPFGIAKYMDAPKGTGSSTARQACACYGDILFTFHHSNDMVEVYNMRTKQRIQVITPSGGSSTIHCNCANFSTQFYDSNDPFPLLYLSNQGCEVWRITGTEGNYIMTLVQTINGLGGIDTYISQDGTMWTIGWGGGASWDTFVQGGYMRFRQFTIPDISQSVVEVNPDSYIKEVRTAWRYSLQGSFIRGNKLYFLWGQPNNSGIDVIDLGGGRMMSSISLSGGGFTKEPEGIFVWKNNLYMTEYPDTNIYRLYT